MAGLLGTLFSSKEDYFAAQVELKNQTRAFPERKLWGKDRFLRETVNDSLLVSGGNDMERAALICSVLNERQGCRVVLHNGNPCLEAVALRRRGFAVHEWDGFLHGQADKARMLAVLEDGVNDRELLVFFSFAMEVCEALRMPIDLVTLAGIDWLGIGWQQDLLQIAERETALDLLDRYDRQMASLAAKAVCSMEKIRRSSGNKPEAFEKAADGNGLVVKNVIGNSSAAVQQCFAVLLDAVERGMPLTLVLDNVYLPGHPLIAEKIRNRKLVLSGEDIGGYSDGLPVIGDSFDIVLFRHNIAESSRKLSLQYFGEFDRLKVETGISIGRKSTSVFSYHQNKSVSIQETRDMRLKPEKIMSLDKGRAVFRLVSGEEGVVQMF